MKHVEETVYIGGILTKHVKIASEVSNRIASAMATSKTLDIQATRWLSWYGVGLASADRLPVVVRIPAGPLGSLKCDPPKGNGRRPKKIEDFGYSWERRVSARCFVASRTLQWPSLVLFVLFWFCLFFRWPV